MLRLARRGTDEQRLPSRKSGDRGDCQPLARSAAGCVPVQPERRFPEAHGPERDLDFILTHIDDLHAVFAVHNGEVQMIPAEGSCPKTHARKPDELPAEVMAEC